MGTEELMATLEALPASAPVALRVLDAIDARISDAASVAGVVEGDPSLTARLLRLANSAYYSPMTAVTTTVRAIGLVGFSAVRALAVTTAAGLNGAEVPTGFWEHSAQTAHAASLLARHFGMKSNEAFALGLLHDMGEGLMCVADAAAWSAIESEWPLECPERLAAERQTYGTTHAELGARLLRAWGLPESSRLAIAEHHSSEPGGPSDRVRASEALVEMVVGEEHRRRVEAEAVLREVGVEPYLVRSAARRIESEAASIVEVLRS
jgi:putative nucleotidyltransferase with HDIG domain